MLKFDQLKTPIFKDVNARFIEKSTEKGVLADEAMARTGVIIKQLSKDIIKQKWSLQDDTHYLMIEDAVIKLAPDLGSGFNSPNVSAFARGCAGPVRHPLETPKIDPG